MPKKHKKHNKPAQGPKTNKPDLTIDHGPAVVVVCVPATRFKYTFRTDPGPDGPDGTWMCVAKSRRDAEKAFLSDEVRAGWKILDVIEEPLIMHDLGIRDPGTMDDRAVRGFTVVKSETENFSVREIRIEPPVMGRRFTFRCEDLDGEEKTWSTTAASKSEAEEVFYRDKTRATWLVHEITEKDHLLHGPRLTSVHAVQFSCPHCGQRVMDRDEVVKASTREATIEVQKENGKTYNKRTRVAKDDDTVEVRTLRDLSGHEMRCPICGNVISDLKGKVWRLSDREVVPSQEYEDWIRKLVKEAPEAPHLSFVDSVPKVVGVRAGLDHRPSWKDLVPWDELKDGGSIANVWVQCPEEFLFVLKDAQELESMSFGNRDDRLGYSGNIGFRPRAIRPDRKEEREKQRPIVTIGEAVPFDFNFVGDVVEV